MLGWSGLWAADSVRSPLRDLPLSVLLPLRAIFGPLRSAHAPFTCLYDASHFDSSLTQQFAFIHSHHRQHCLSAVHSLRPLHRRPPHRRQTCRSGRLYANGGFSKQRVLISGQLDKWCSLPFHKDSMIPDSEDLTAFVTQSITWLESWLGFYRQEAIRTKAELQNESHFCSNRIHSRISFSLITPQCGFFCYNFIINFYACTNNSRWGASCFRVVCPSVRCPLTPLSSRLTRYFRIQWRDLNETWYKYSSLT